MEAITASAPLVLPRLNRPLVTVVPRRAQPRLPEIPGRLFAGSALVVGAAALFAFGSVGLFF